MTYGGGNSGYGVIFEYDPSTNIFIKRKDFNSSGGYYPLGSLISVTHGKLYGMTSNGGSISAGVIFEYDPFNNTYTEEINFNLSNGHYPNGSLLKASNGMLYGMTSTGGINNYGVIFEFNPFTTTYTKKIDFNGSNGAFPNGKFIEASNGKLYSTTSSGGNNSFGVIFEYDPTTNIYTKIKDLNGIDGNYPYGSLMEASNGKLYGMTRHGGAYNSGVIFEYDPFTNTYTKKKDFNGLDGSHPYGTLIESFNGKLYGMATGGGNNNFGTIFEYAPTTNIFTKKKDLNWLDGAFPFGSFIEISDNKLYALTSNGGSSGFGVIFEYDPLLNTYTKKKDFYGFDGANPEGSLIKGSNNYIYGMTTSGGNYSQGVLFSYEPDNQNYQVKKHLKDNFGAYPKNGLIEIFHCNITVDAVKDTMVFYGNTAIQNYSCTDLTVNITGGTAPFTYNWSSSSSYVIPVNNTQTINVCPEVTTTFTVTVTDAYGCAVTDEVTVNAYEAAMSGNGNNTMVAICLISPNSGNNTIYVNSNAVPNILANNPWANIGPCEAYAKKEDNIYLTESALSIYPNPAANEINICYFNEREDEISIILCDNSGRKIKEIVSLSSNQIQYKFSLKDLCNGIYYVRLTDSHHRLLKIEKIIKTD